MLYGSRSKEQKTSQAINFLVDENILPQTLSLLKTRANPLGIKIILEDPETFELNKSFFGLFSNIPVKKDKFLI